MGLALIAEERSQWDVAEQRYQEILSLADGVLAGTVYPHVAAGRLKALPDIREPIEFPVGVGFAGSSVAGYAQPGPIVEPSLTDEAGSGAEATTEPPPALVQITSLPQILHRYFSPTVSTPIFEVSFLTPLPGGYFTVSQQPGSPG